MVRVVLRHQHIRIPAIPSRAQCGLCDPLGRAAAFRLRELRQAKNLATASMDDPMVEDLDETEASPDPDPTLQLSFGRNTTTALEQISRRKRLCHPERSKAESEANQSAQSKDPYSFFPCRQVPWINYSNCSFAIGASSRKKIVGAIVETTMLRQLQSYRGRDPQRSSRNFLVSKTS